MAISTKWLPTFKPSEQCCGTSSIQSHSATSSRSSSPTLPLPETTGLETQQRPTSKTSNVKKTNMTCVKGSTNVEKKDSNLIRLEKNLLIMIPAYAENAQYQLTITLIPFNASVATDCTVNFAVA